MKQHKEPAAPSAPHRENRGCSLLSEYLKRKAAIHGDCLPDFAPVREAFCNNFDAGELGAAVAVHYRGRLVVDLWGGFQDLQQTEEWRRTTRVCGFSLNKTITSTFAHLAAHDGLLDYDTPVARYWPEFAAGGKENVTVRQVLSHTAGMPGIRRALSREDSTNWTLLGDSLAEQRPFWQPGTHHGYHMGTYGVLVAQLVERLRGRPFPQLFDELCKRLSIHPSLNVSERADIATFVQPEAISIPRDDDPERREMLKCIYHHPPDVGGADISGRVPFDDIPANTDHWRARLNPSVCGFWTARDLARFGAAYTRSSTLLAPEVREESLREQVRGPDAVLGVPTCFAMGFRRWQEERTIGPNPRGSFFAHGFGGALLVVDEDLDFSVAYLMNATGPRNSWLNRFNSALVLATYESVNG